MLILAYAASRAVSAAMTPVPDVDSVRYMALAERWADGDFSAVLAHPYHPLYPALLGIWSLVVPGPETAGYALSIILSALTLAPVYLAGAEIGGRRAAWTAAVLFAITPAPFRASATILTEPLFVLLCSWTAWACALALTRGQARHFLLAGAFAGLAYLARPEGPAPLAALIAAMAFPPAAGAFSAISRRIRPPGASAAADVAEAPQSGGQALPAGALQAQPASRMLLHAALAAALFAAAAAPYMASIGGVTAKKRVARMAAAVAAPGEHGFAEDQLPAAPDSPPKLDRFETFGLDPSLEKRQEPLASPALEAASSILRAGSFVVFPLSVIGIPVLWRRGARDRRLRACAVFYAALIAVHFLMLWALAAGYRYVSLRHGIPLAAMTMPLAGLGAAAAWDSVTGRFGRAGTAALAAAALAAGVFFVLQDFRPLRHGKSHIREVGLWLGSHAESGPSIISTDPRYSFYAGGTYVHLGICGYSDLADFASQRGIKYLVDSREHILRTVRDFDSSRDDRTRRVITGLEGAFLPRVEPAVYEFRPCPAGRGGKP